MDRWKVLKESQAEYLTYLTKGTGYRWILYMESIEGITGTG
jgi:hypothetical protein